MRAFLGHARAGCPAASARGRCAAARLRNSACWRGAFVQDRVRQREETAARVRGPGRECRRRTSGRPSVFSPSSLPSPPHRRRACSSARLSPPASSAGAGSRPARRCGSWRPPAWPARRKQARPGGARSRRGGECADGRVHSRVPHRVRSCGLGAAATHATCAATVSTVSTKSPFAGSFAWRQIAASVAVRVVCGADLADLVTGEDQPAAFGRGLLENGRTSSNERPSRPTASSCAGRRTQGRWRPLRGTAARCGRAARHGRHVALHLLAAADEGLTAGIGEADGSVPISCSMGGSRPTGPARGAGACSPRGRFSGRRRSCRCTGGCRVVADLVARARPPPAVEALPRLSGRT